MGPLNSKHAKKYGFYTPNAVLCFFIAVVMLMLPFLGKRLAYPIYSVKNPAIQKILHAVAEPVIAVTEPYPAAKIIPSLRLLFLHATGLDTMDAWDTFFYQSDTFSTSYPSSTPLPSHSIPHAAIPLTPATAVDATNSTNAKVSHSNILQPAYTVMSTGYPLKAGEKPKQAYKTKLIPYSNSIPLKLLFFGDSQMYFIANGMKRALKDTRNIHIESISVHSSGFLRSDYYNWPKKLAAVLNYPHNNQNRPFDAAVMLLGMNDFQDIYTASGKTLTAGSLEWEKQYTTMVRHHIDIVLKNLPRLYWLGLPAVRKTSYNKKIEYMDTLYTAIAQSYGQNSVIKISLTNFTSQHRSSYIDSVQSESGIRIPLMQQDGIHYTLAGSEFLMQSFLNRLRQDYLFEEVSAP